MNMADAGPHHHVVDDRGCFSRDKTDAPSGVGLDASSLLINNNALPRSVCLSVWVCGCVCVCVCVCESLWTVSVAC